MYVFESNLCLNQLTEQEEQARDKMVYLFNPVLKYILAHCKPEEFARYGFNSCRQTAILGAAYLKKLLPDYNIVPYEGTFIEKLPTGTENYVHAFILLSKDKRMLLADLSRTTKRLIFGEASAFLYPSVEEYKDMVLVNKTPINLYDMIYTDEPEYFTGKKPTELLEIIETLIGDLEHKTQIERDAFCDTIYGLFTKIRR